VSLRLYAIPLSTNVERVALAMGHKGLEAEVVMCDPRDRSPIRDVSGQELVPVLVDDDEVVTDSSRIVEHLERRFPDPSLFPSEPARAAEVRLFVDWFDRAWKRPPNELEAEIRKPRPSRQAIQDHRAALRGSLQQFDGLLDGRPYLMGDDFTAADVAAFPFLKYAFGLPPSDDELFHRILAENLTLEGAHPRVEEWLQRVDVRPRGPLQDLISSS
jgi:glutathione S-transferase